MKPDVVFLISDGSFQSSLNPQGIPWNDFKKAADSVKDASDDPCRFNFITFEASEDDTKELKRISNRNGGKIIELKK
jgi:Mg-chelatase subunit ChlD